MKNDMTDISKVTDFITKLFYYCGKQIWKEIIV